VFSGARLLVWRFFDILLSVQPLIWSTALLCCPLGMRGGLHREIS